jgi:hypothetical protein
VAGSASDKLGVGRLILWPAVFTLAVTILRLEGELHHWSSVWFSASAGGGGAIVGISWLPILFGPYFALKLARSGDAPASYGKAFGTMLGGLALMILGSALIAVTESHPGLLTILGFLIILFSAFVPSVGWRSLGSTLLAYAFAARIPVLVVMYLAMSGSWGTHYDAVPARFQNMTLWKKFFDEAFLPQMFLWIGYTVVIGSLFGETVAALFGRRRSARANA